MARRKVKKTTAASRTAESHDTEIGLAEKEKQMENKNEAFRNPEVERQIAGIRAICDIEIEHLLTAVRLLRSNFSEQQLQAPVLQFFEENLPNVTVINGSDGQVDLKWKHQEDKFSLQNVDTIDNYASLLRHMSMSYPHISEVWQSASVFPFPSTAGNAMLDATNFLSIGNHAFEDPYQSLMQGMQDGLQTPGVNGQRLSIGGMSVGMTPKTQRHPKHGEMLLSVYGSPLGVFKEDNNMEAIVESEEA